jgi:tripartite-type tricarboxylate transporter receptor subunit TctC
MKGHRIFVIMALCIVLAVPLSATAETWKPAKPIKLIVPWGAGGSTDQVTRVCAGELEAALGQKIVVVNQPGASGSIGTKNTLDAPRDGYTWTSGAAKDLGTYQVLGMIDTNIRDWNLFLNISLPQVVAVRSDSPYKSFDDLLNYGFLCRHQFGRSFRNRNDQKVYRNFLQAHHL